MDKPSHKILKDPALVASATEKIRLALSRSIPRDVATIAEVTRLPIEATRYILDQAVHIGAVERTKRGQHGTNWGSGTTWLYREAHALPADFNTFVDKQAEIGLDLMQRRGRN